ncbi:hypothetical protein PG993_013972 [Apiospora rasikravindrae]|uniref:Uncharacterized protein n=1 Tax=Apiospora rasikravindrae TaxID=990691 RepID=A0ABR1RSU1_9PEZI
MVTHVFPSYVTRSHLDVRLVGGRVALARDLALEHLHEPDALEAHVRQLVAVLQVDGHVEALLRVADLHLLPRLGPVAEPHDDLGHVADQHSVVEEVPGRHHGRGHGLWLGFLFIFCFQVLAHDDSAVVQRCLLRLLLLVLLVFLLLLLLFLQVLLLRLLLRRVLLVGHLLDQAHGVLELVPPKAAGDGRRMGDELAVVAELELGVVLVPLHGLRDPDPLEAEAVVGSYAVIEQVRVEETPRVVGLVGVQVPRLAVRAGRGSDLVLVAVVLMERELLNRKGAISSRIPT